MGFIRWIVGFFVALAAAVFAVSNRQYIEFHMTPMDAGYDVPLYAIGLALMGFGFLMGVVTTWLNGASVRQSRRKQRRQIKALEKTLDSIQGDKKAAQPPSDFFPELTKRVTKSPL